MKKFTLSFLIDPKNSWIEKYLRSIKYSKKKYKINFEKDQRKIKNVDIVLVLSYTRILKNSFLKKNNLVLIAHPSNLPKDRGFAPVQNQILKNKKKIYFSLLKAVKKVDAGPICLKMPFFLNGDELYDEMRLKQGKAAIKLIEIFLKKYPKINFRNQIGKSTYNKKRTNKDYELDINNSIKSQFNILQICNNDDYPAYFIYKKNKYILKIFKDKDVTNIK